ncbi:MAG: alpha/beta hydrolase [Phycisphaerae bacterium]|nr:alpha/beta hydrolase [Phycisphaerae bacterium]
MPTKDHPKRREVKPLQESPRKPRRRIRKLFWAIFRIVLFSITGFVIILYFFQSRFVFFPSREIGATPDDVALMFEPVEIQTDDGVKITGWFVPAKDARGTALFFHGNGGNISHRLDSLRIFHSLSLNTLIIDYRGYGLSEGKPSEEGIYLDAQAAWKYLVERRDTAPEKIIIFGRSLGGAVAVHLAGKNNPKALIVESTCTSIPEIGSDLYPFLPRALLRRLSRYQFNAREGISQAACPVLVVHSRDDDMIPFAHGRAIFDAAGEPKEFLEITGSHNDGFVASGQTYRNGLDKFVSSHLKISGN